MILHSFKPWQAIVSEQSEAGIHHQGRWLFGRNDRRARSIQTVAELLRIKQGPLASPRAQFGLLPYLGRDHGLSELGRSLDAGSAAFCGGILCSASGD